MFFLDRDEIKNKTIWLSILINCNYVSLFQRSCPLGMSFKCHST